MKRVLAVTALMLLLTGCGSSSSSDQTKNGSIALSGQPSLSGAQGIFLRDPNGSLSRLTTVTNGRDVFPSWSHDGKRIAYLRMSDDLEDGTARLLVMNADGTDAHQVRDVVATAGQIAWSPDDDLLVFTAAPAGVWTVKADGSEPKRQIFAENAADPSWSVDGRIVISRLIGHGLTSMNADGGDVRVLTHPKRQPKAVLPDLHSHPAWSPDGKRIAFIWRVWLRTKDLLYPTTIEIVNADGTGQRTLTKIFDESSTTLSWSPDGRFIAFTDLRGVPGLWKIPSGGGPATALIGNSSSYSMPSWGPAGA
ncbi:MAG: PD40 domain-containing protein [Actinobacteria bacterium]|nr:PD40 domain-containing protein [Actinomycetota bacterium]